MTCRVKTHNSSSCSFSIRVSSDGSCPVLMHVVSGKGIRPLSQIRVTSSDLCVRHSEGVRSAEEWVVDDVDPAAVGLAPQDLGGGGDDWGAVTRGAGEGGRV
jgi:hypothetical protein